MNWFHHILCKCFCLFLLLVAGNDLLAQEGKNPFEIPNREASTPIIPEETSPVDDIPLSSSAESIPAVDTSNTQNPFDLQADAPPLENPEPETNFSTGENPFEIKRIPTGVNSPKKVAPSPVLQPQKSTYALSDRYFLSVVALILIIVFTVLIALYRVTVGQVYRAFLNDNILKLKQREQGAFLHISLFLLYVSFFLNAGFFCYLIAKNFGDAIQNHWQVLAFFTLGVSGVFFIKHLFLRLLGVIFPINKELRQYSFIIVIFNIILGILLLPFNLLIAFGPGELSKYMIYSFLAILGLIYCFRFIRSLLIASRHISLNKFHFFMYLCTVEIAPTLVLVKLLLMIQG